MALDQIKLGKTIEVTYQATKAQSGLTDVTMEIFDETGAKDGTNFPDVIMIEISTTGRYKGSFAPDQEGKWRYMIDSASKSGKVVGDIEVVGHDVDSVGDVVVSIETKADGIKAKTDLIPADPASASHVSSAEANIRGIDGDTLKDISDQIDGIVLESAPIIG